MGRHELAYTFNRMAEALDSAMKGLCEEDEDIVRVEFEIKTCTFSVHVIPIYDSEHPNFDPSLWDE